MRDDGGVVGILGHLHGVEGLGEGTDLVHLDEDRVGGAGLDALLEELGVGDEEIVADELHLAADGVGELLPGRPVAFGAAVLDRDDRVLGGELLVEGDHLVAGVDLAGGLLEDVVLLLLHVELGGGDVEGEVDVLAELVAGVLDGEGDGIEGRLGGLELRGEAAFVTDGGGEALFLQDLLEGVEDFAAHAQAFGEGRGAEGHDHEFLEVDRGIGVRAAVHDVHHRNGEDLGVRPAEVLVERDVEGGGGGLGHGHGDGENGVGAELGLGLGAIELDHRAVDADLIDRIHADDGRGDDGLDVVDGGLDALAQEALLAVDALGQRLGGRGGVAQFDGLVLAGAGAGRDGRAAEGAAGELDVDLNGRVAAGVDDLAGDDVGDGGGHRERC